MGVWDALHDKLRSVCREQAGKKSSTTAVIDLQAVKTTEQADNKGYNVAKKIKGIKRHIVVDTLGLLLNAEVTSANINDRFASSTMIGKITNKFINIIKI